MALTYKYPDGLHALGYTVDEDYEFRAANGVTTFDSADLYWMSTDTEPTQTAIENAYDTLHLSIDSDETVRLNRISSAKSKLASAANLDSDELIALVRDLVGQRPSYTPFD